ncbi:glycosyltransferase [Sphingobium sp. AN641]|uniref:glycosyltransferase n=1 Tax=Sphingobium sp. AN641 TaxID=3133443 RepID=UPI0030C4B87D
MGEGTARPPRLLHLHSSFSLGGKEARAVRLMNLWGNRARHAIVSGVAADMGASAAIAQGVDVAFPDDIGLVGPLRLGRLRALARRMADHDLILTYNWGAMDAVMAHRLFSRSMALPPLIHHEDGFNIEEANGLKTRRNLYRRLALATAHALVVPSVRLETVARRIWMQPARRVHLVRNGIDIERYARPPAPDGLPGFCRTPGKLVVGTLAGLRPVKNIPRLVRAVARNRDRLQLVVVGEGEERDAIQREARAQGLDDFHMAGFLAEPWRFMGLFDIFALSSDSEQFPISLVEAMAAGLPVASTDVGDVANMVAPENRSLVVGAEDALASALGLLADDADLRQRLGTANRERARRDFAEDVMVDAYARLYGEALARPDIFR